MKWILWGVAAQLLVCAPVYGQSQFQNLDDLDAAIEAFAKARLGSPGGATQRVDRRLHLAPCSNAPLLSWYGNHHTAIEVRCVMPGGWKIYAPILKPSDGGEASVPNVVSRGDVVSMVVTGDGFSIHREAEALEGGALGEWIRVKLDAKGSVKRAKVIDEGMVGIDLP